MKTRVEDVSLLYIYVSHASDLRIKWKDVCNVIFMLMARTHTFPPLSYLVLSQSSHPHMEGKNEA